jgi:hypothetical protein
MRCSCTADAARDRLARQIAISGLHNQDVWIDGYNVLTTIEAALGGAVLLIGRDGCLRDMCSMHGTYRKVAETIPAARLVGEFCAQAGVTKCVWLLDSPVSNSGRLKTLLRQTAESAGWAWQIELVADPDRVLCTANQIVATADSAVLDKCPRWFPLTEKIVHQRLSSAWIVDLATLCEPLIGEALVPKSANRQH